MEAEQIEQKMIGLKSQIKKEVFVKNRIAKELDDTNKSIFMSLHHMIQTNNSIQMKSLVENALWDLNFVQKPWKSCNSRVFGIKTTIKEYTNQKGYTFLAHFTENGMYLYPVNSKKPEPEYYEGWFRITTERFQVDWRVFEDKVCLIQNLENCFTPIK